MCVNILYYSLSLMFNMLNVLCSIERENYSAFSYMEHLFLNTHLIQCYHNDFCVCVWNTVFHDLKKTNSGYREIIFFSLLCADVYDDSLDKCFLLKWQFCVSIVETALKQKWIQFYCFETCERIIFVLLPLDILH